MLFFWAWVWFAVAGGGTLTDPAEILTEGAQATADAESFHFALTVEGSMTDADSGAPVQLDGMTVSGDLDMAADAAHVTFSLPMLFGMQGEAILIGQDVYLLTAMAGDQWLHFMSTDEAEAPTEDPPTDEEIAAKVDELLATEGVSLTMLADQACGDDTCYHLQLSVSAEAMAAHHGDMPDLTGLEVLGSQMPVPELGGDAVLDLLFQQDGLWLREVSVASQSEAGEGLVRFEMSDFNTGFDIGAPPADQVIEGEDFPLFQ
jgi:hypothetical protein